MRCSANNELATCKGTSKLACVLVQPDGWARGEREGYGEPCDVTSLSLSGHFRGSAGERITGGRDYRQPVLGSRYYYLCTGAGEF